MAELKFDPALGSYKIGGDPVPQNHGEYLPRLFRYDIPNFDHERSEFAGRAFREKMSLKQAEDAWDAHCKTLIRQNDNAVQMSILTNQGNGVSMTPAEAALERRRILADQSHPYYNKMDKHNQASISYMNRLLEIASGQKTNFDNYMDGVEMETAEERRQKFGPRISSGSGGERFQPFEPFKTSNPETPTQEALRLNQEFKSGHGSGISDIPAV